MQEPVAKTKVQDIQAHSQLWQTLSLTPRIPTTLGWRPGQFYLIFKTKINFTKLGYLTNGCYK